MGMSIPYESAGRTKQKMRTRAALVEAARALIATGITPTVEDAASEASISRTTAYRYFPNQRNLLVAAHPQIDASSMLGDDPPDDAAERLDIVVDAYLRMTLENEPALRTALRVSLEAEGPHRDELVLRQGRVIGWLNDALEPLLGRLSKRALARLVYAIRSAVGIESLIWLRDVAGLSSNEAVDVMKWSARSLLQSALTDTNIKATRQHVPR
jgi:AcrR family transcriptional regulator